MPEGPGFIYAVDEVNRWEAGESDGAREVERHAQGHTHIYTQTGTRGSENTRALGMEKQGNSLDHDSNNKAVR